jgi:chromosome segregation ATPase
MTDEVKTKFAETVSGTIHISEEGETLIKSAFETNTPQTKFAEVSANQFPVVSGEVSTLITMLQQELDAKNRQLENKDKQIGELTAALENTTASLHAAQALHAGTMHKQLEADAATEPAHQKQEESGFFSRLKYAFTGKN